MPIHWWFSDVDEALSLLARRQKDERKHSPSIQARALTLVLLLLGMLTRILQRPHKDRLRTRIQTLNCRTLLDDQRLDDLDDALMEKKIDICALQETRRGGFVTTSTKNYSIFTFGECSGKYGVGFAIHKRYAHLITETRGVPETDGRLMFVKMLLQDTKHPTTLICAYAPTNTSRSDISANFY